jgi:tetratricopeptide (TPR) repeat protein
LIGLGRQEESLDAIEKALEILNLSTERNPKDGEAWWSKANVLYGIGRSDEALQAYEKVIELNHTPRLADALLIKGYDFAIKGNYDEFKETFNQAIGLIPASDTAKLARTWNSAGFALAELGKEEEAFEAFEKYAQLSPGDRHSWRMKGDMASELGRYNVSIEAYDQALRIDPKWAEVWYKKGNALAKMDNHNDALKAFEKAVEISDEVIQKDAGNASGICIIKGYALIKLNRYDEAIEALDRALEIAPSSVPVFPAEAWNGKGDILLALGKNEDALEAYNKSIEFNPAFGRAWHGKGLAQSALGQFSEADLSFRVARKLGYQE